jgi:hypothetical protein
MAPEGVRNVKIDFQMSDEGEIVLFTPLTERAREWVGTNVAEDRQWFGASLMIESEFAGVLVKEMLSEGLSFVESEQEYAQ